MINVFTLYERLLAKVNTHQMGHARPVRNFEPWVNDISLELFEEYYKAFQKSHHISDNLTIFLRSGNVKVQSLSGQMHDLVPKPDDYERWAAMRIIHRKGETFALKGLPAIECDGKKFEPTAYVDADEVAFAQARADTELKEARVEKIDTARWSALATRIRKGASLTSPKCTQYDEGFKLAPKGLGVVVMDYFRKPAPVKFNYIIVNPNTEAEAIQYVEAESKHLEWPESMIGEFLSRLEIAYGGFKGNAAVLQKGMMEREMGK